MPRFFTLDPTGKWLLLLNHDSDNAIVFRVEEGTGLLTQTGTPVQVPNPFCARFLSPP
jgi:6-phosphogluconolactonase (cycloisomerase 2 family)